MRLICPNCGAQYEVPDDVIPAEGRDVQCSNCGHTWFFDARVKEQDPEDVTAEPPEDTIPPTPTPQEARDKADLGPSAETPAPGTVEPEEDVEGLPIMDEAAIPEIEVAPEGTSQPEVPKSDPRPWDNDRPVDVEMDDSAPAEDGAGSPSDEAPRAVRKPPLKQGVADILRAEVEHEAALRQAEGGAIESQPDLGLQDLGRRKPEYDAPQDSEAEETPVTAPARTSRRDLLPDIEEINSTLTATSARKSVSPQTAEEVEALSAKKRSGFRFGFGLTLLIFAIIIAAYVNADKLIEYAPQFEAQITQFVDQVNAARIWLDGTVKSLVEQLKAAAE